MSKSSKKEAAAATAGSGGEDVDAQVLRHLRLGWWTILVFLTLGIALEAMHGLKIGWYLNVDNETRRLMFTLAHSHGALIGVLHLGFAATAKLRARALPALASLALSGSGLLLPAGFLLGGAVTYGGDPGKGILLVPIGAALLLLSALQTALTLRR